MIYTKIKEFFYYIIYFSLKYFNAIKQFNPIKSSFDKDPYFRAHIRGNEVSKLISSNILSNKPFLIARLGAVELSCIKEYMIQLKLRKMFGLDIYKIIFNKQVKFGMSNNAGFFNPDDNKLIAFSNLMIESIKITDIAGTYLKDEDLLKKEYDQAVLVPLCDLEPFKHDNPWTKFLEGKKVLVIHPFEKSIRTQYGRRKEWLKKYEFCPDFELITIKAVQTATGMNSNFSDWFEALDSMKRQIDKVDFDIALIGCGAYGYPLGAYIKTIGKQAIHLGGALQLLFGIIGKRWEVPGSYINDELINENWIRPLPEDTYSGNEKVEGGCYW